MNENNNKVVLAEICIPPSRATLGMTFCPGKPDAQGNQADNVENNIKAIKAWGADAVVSLVNNDEMTKYQIEDLGEQVTAQGMTWFHQPFEDGGIPGQKFAERWEQQREEMHGILKKGGKLMVHCRGGKGRTGLICARLMLEMGVDFEQTVSLVQKNRAGALGKQSHIDYLKSI